MIDLWRARLRQHVQAQQKYLRLVFNDPKKLWIIRRL